MSKKRESIQFILTGGTIDSYYDGIKDAIIPNKISIIPDYIRNLKLYNKITFTEICMKDSRALTKKDLRKILNTIEKSKYKKIIITHGTYTLSDTARYLQANLKQKNHTIVFVASMLPMKEFSVSDGAFNLGFAVSQVQELPAGVYICMNGTVFSPDEVTKLISEGRYISIFTK